jgi:predicted enzyme related to lactoylglutathione lyase
MGNPVVHFEICAAEDEPLVKFYGALFGWGLEAVPGGYTLVDTRAGGGINGGIGRSETGRAWSIFYVAVEDPQAFLDRAEALGGTTVTGVTEVPGMVTYALFEDPDGLLVGLVKDEPPPDGAPVGPSAGDGAAVDWFEVLGADAGRSQAFYRELFGWTVGEGRYGQVDTGVAGGIGGGIGAGGEVRWATVYASVADVEATLARAEALGGGRVYGPRLVDDHMRTGALRDPAGNVVGVYHHPPH